MNKPRVKPLPEPAPIKGTRHRCPKCGRFASCQKTSPECDKCRLFFCTKCRRWYSWDYGCDGNYPYWCDGCWYKKTKGKKPR